MPFEGIIREAEEHCKAHDELSGRQKLLAADD
jgi:hypothetical protein